MGSSDCLNHRDSFIRKYQTKHNHLNRRVQLGNLHNHLNSRFNPIRTLIECINDTTSFGNTIRNDQPAYQANQYIRSNQSISWLTMYILITMLICLLSVSLATSSTSYGSAPIYSLQNANQTASSPSKYVSLSKFKMSNYVQSLLIQTSLGHVIGTQQILQLRASSVDPKTGQYRIQADRFEQHAIDVFHGIPYAVPPLNQLRFKPPKPSVGWTGQVFNATVPADACVQYPDLFFGGFEGSIMWNPATPMHEDCLTLTIWMAERNNPNRFKSKTDAKLLPVLVWIYGGGFYSGSTEVPAYDYSVFAALNQMIVVAINYRVASLGFYYTGNSDAPGNVGLLDQVLALKWIQTNIHLFGGDPNQVTLVGESAGAVSIGLHLRSPLSAGLFQRAILQSGAATCPWGTDHNDNALWRSLMLAHRVGCLQECPDQSASLNASINAVEDADDDDDVQSKNRRQSGGRTKDTLDVIGSGLDAESKSDDDMENETDAIDTNQDNFWKSEGQLTLQQLKYWANHQPNWMKCMRETNASLLIEKEWHNLNLIQFPALPVVDGFYLTKRPQVGEQISLDSSHSNLDLLVGSVSEESNFFLVYELTEFLNLSEQVGVTHKQLQDTVRRHFRREDPLLVDAILSTYTSWPDPGDVIANRDMLDKVFGDSSFTCHVNEMAHRYTEAGANVYYYYFKHRSSLSPWPKWMGVLHADEIAFVIGQPLLWQKNYTEPEIKLSYRMMSMWANFASTGNPLLSLPGQFNPVQNESWPRHSIRKREYKQLTLNNEHVTGSGPRMEKCAFWLNYIPDFRKKLFKLRSPCSAAFASWCTVCIQSRPLFLAISFVYFAFNWLVNQFYSVSIIKPSTCLLFTI